LLEEDRKAIYTAPDKTVSKLLMLDLEGDTNLTEDVVLSGNVYFRRNNIDTQNGDDADYDDCAGGTLLCYEDTNDQVIDSGTGNPVPFAPGGHEIDGTNNMTRTEQDGYGGNLQLTFMNDMFVGENQLTVGAGWDNADVHYNAKTYLAYLDPWRSAISTDYIDQDSFVRIDAYTRNYGLYFTDTWSVTPALDLTVSGRYNHSHITLKDRIDGAASGRHSYSHFNPAVGAVYTFVPEFATYARYSVSNRAPTPMELTCSNPAAPCRLP